MPQTLIVTGMHRSGTSLTASFIKAIGVNLGDNLYEADLFNIKGYFEDVDFLEFQRSLLQECCRPGEAGWSDWGWTESEWLDSNKFENYLKEAQDLIQARDSQSGIWGWKDPRTSLMLEFWDRLIPDARYLLVYRLPWDVADSILRLNSPVFCDRPDYPLRIWAFYNRHLLNFYAKHGDRCILLNINAFLQSPNQIVELLETKLKLKVAIAYDPTKFAEIYDHRLFNSLDSQHPVVQILQHIAPQYFTLLAELDRVADIPSNFSSDALSYPIESLPLSLHRQAIENHAHIQSLHNQIQQHKLECQKEIDMLNQELLTIKRSKLWKVKQKIAQLQEALKGLLQTIQGS